jgi:hypothetical protein
MTATRNDMMILASDAASDIKSGKGVISFARLPALRLLSSDFPALDFSGSDLPDYNPMCASPLSGSIPTV